MNKTPSRDDDKPNDTKKRTQIAPQDETEENRKAQIGSGVMALLGDPPNFASVEAKRVGVGRYRVNVRVESPTEQQLVQETRIAHSYYVDVDAAGNVLFSTPAIKRLYGVCVDYRTSF